MPVGGSATGTRFTVDSCSSFVDDGAGGDGVGDMRIDRQSSTGIENVTVENC